HLRPGAAAERTSVARSASPPPSSSAPRSTVSALIARCRSFDVELDPLRQRQGRAVVDGVGGAAHVGAPAVGAGFAAAAGLLLAAEGAADLRPRGADVDVDHAAVGARRREEALGL